MAWVGVAVAAIDRKGRGAVRAGQRSPGRVPMGQSGVGLVTLAAMALPGVFHAPAHAEDAPTQGRVAVKYLHYSDGQSVATQYPYYDGTQGDSLKRITVNSPAVSVLVPISNQWSLEGGLVVDQVSGASPRYYSDVSGASRMSDTRVAGDVKIVRYFDRASYAVGASISNEHDYRSTALSLDGKWSSADNNTTWNLGLGGSIDAINPTQGGQHNVVGERKGTAEIIAGVTQVLSRNDIVQFNMTASHGRGYFSDPYKLYDNRPRRRSSGVGLVRWNHHFEDVGGTLRTGYRFYGDTFGIRAHTLDLGWTQPFGESFKLTPSMRYYSQSAASFYYDPVTDAQVYPGPLDNPSYTTTDQRMSAFGGLTVGLKAEWRSSDFTTDLKVERYEQRPDWRLGGSGSQGIDRFRAIFVQLGVSRPF
jgi:hypothetical protein